MSIFNSENELEINLKTLQLSAETHKSNARNTFTLNHYKIKNNTTFSRNFAYSTQIMCLNMPRRN